MGEVRDRFEEAKKRGRNALIPFIMSGDPSPSATVRIAEVLEKSGVDMIELGLCFSDPIADGPTIQAASQRALASGVTPDVYFEIAKSIRESVQLPLIALTYYNPVFHMGVPRFLQKCAESGISGIIVPDLPVDEAREFISVARGCDVDTIFLATLTSPASRLKKIVKESTGFVYLVSVLGVTGARRKFSHGVRGLIEKVKKIGTDVPVAVGFGVSSPSHVSQAGRMGADGVIVGSAIVDLIAKNFGDERDMLAKLERYVRSLVRATKV